MHEATPDPLTLAVFIVYAPDSGVDGGLEAAGKTADEVARRHGRLLKLVCPAHACTPEIAKGCVIVASRSLVAYCQRNDQSACWAHTGSSPKSTKPFVEASQAGRYLLRQGILGRAHASNGLRFRTHWYVAAFPRAAGTLLSACAPSSVSRSTSKLRTTHAHAHSRQFAQTKVSCRNQGFLPACKCVLCNFPTSLTIGCAKREACEMFCAARG
eukprot:6185365-Pleurochrysis_carterae.AAC.2